MAPATVCKLIERDGYKGLVGIGAVQIETLCNLGLARAQLAFEHKGHAARIAFADSHGNIGSALDNAVCTRLVTSLDLVGVEPLDARLHCRATHLANHNHPELAVFLGDRTHSETQACSRMPHHQTSAVAHTLQALGDKRRDIPLERSIAHGRNRDVPASIDCQRRGPGSSQGLNQNLQLGVAVHVALPVLGIASSPATTRPVFQN